MKLDPLKEERVFVPPPDWNYVGNGEDYNGATKDGGVVFISKQVIDMSYWSFCLTDDQIKEIFRSEMRRGAW